MLVLCGNYISHISGPLLLSDTNESRSIYFFGRLPNEGFSYKKQQPTFYDISFEARLTVIDKVSNSRVSLDS